VAGDLKLLSLTVAPLANDDYKLLQSSQACLVPAVVTNLSQSTDVAIMV
jgi:hypothetical protein